MLLSKLHLNKDKQGKKNNLVNVAQIGMQIRVLEQLLFGALEQAIVNKIKPNQSSEQTDVRQGQFVSTQETRTPQVNIQHVQCIKQLIHCLVIRLLALGKSTPAHKARINTVAFGS